MFLFITSATILFVHLPVPGYSTDLISYFLKTEFGYPQLLQAMAESEGIEPSYHFHDNQSLAGSYITPLSTLRMGMASVVLPAMD